jgi:excinuclease ABC subunit C
VDGGKGQLEIARSVAEELGLDDLPLLGIAKGRERNAGRETLHQIDRPEPLALAHRDERRHFLQRLRDEAHRFAITYHRALRSRRDRRSELLRVPGVGPVRLRSLLSTLGSLEAVRSATLEDLERVPGMTERAARSVHQHLRREAAASGEPALLRGDRNEER